MSYPELDAARAGWRHQPSAQALAGKVIVVTGAGDGIGRTAAQTFASYGASVVLLGRTRQKLEGVCDWINAHTDTDPAIVPCDLTMLGTESALALHDAIADQYGRLDGLVHNASALGPKVPIEQYPIDAWQRVFQVNVHAPMLLTQSLLPLLRAAERASILMTSSSVGRTGRAYWGAYSASKFALEGLMQILNDELENTTGIRVNSVNPGGTRTAMRARAYPAEDPATVPAPEAHMDMYVYLMSDASAAVTGAALDCRDWSGA